MAGRGRWSAVESPLLRNRRFSFLAGWTAVILLAVAGFAAFNNPNPSADEVQVEAAAASMGHTSGAYAGLAFALLGTSDDSGASQPRTDANSEEVLTLSDVASNGGGDDEESSTGTIASPVSGWLSELEVRALVSLYFEPEDVNRAVRVAWCESRFDPDSVDMRTGGVGLFHHLPKYWAERSANAGFAGTTATDPEASAAAAAWAVYNGGGWDVFSCRG